MLRINNLLDACFVVVADTLNEATDRCNALQAREALLAALLDQAQRLDGGSAGDASPKPPASPKASPPKA